MRSSRLPITCALVVIAALGGGPAADAAESTAPKRPNIVFIFSDDHSPNAIGAYDRWLKSMDPTPAIDRLAAQGMTFARSYCTNSICGPVRAVIETGKHSHLNGFQHNGQKFDWHQPTFPLVTAASSCCISIVSANGNSATSKPIPTSKPTNTATPSMPTKSPA